MIPKSRIQLGLEIFANSWGRYDLLGEHDIIYVFTPNNRYDAENCFSEDATKKLSELGWIHSETDGWFHYT